MSETLLTPEEVAQQLRVTEQTVYNWLRAGDLAGLKAGRLWRIRSAELAQFLGSNAPVVTPGPKVSARGKYAHVATSSEVFAAGKQQEIALEDRSR